MMHSRMTAFIGESIRLAQVYTRPKNEYIILIKDLHKNCQEGILNGKGYSKKLC